MAADDLSMVETGYQKFKPSPLKLSEIHQSNDKF
ncbi:hypothetical protein HC248_03221 [Polaromonas vacuolata]|uniref:Uncharacterized protein n=1 Tax=Polaromonas vacuolata TaxID=37448 RepID=A0A6H2HDC1_9BURK|nr:hypothetical protein HC248_03221 [Polaromonas vacuolata]